MKTNGFLQKNARNTYKFVCLPPGTTITFCSIPFFSYIITCIIKTDFYNFLMKSSIEFNKKIRVYY